MKALAEPSSFTLDNGLTVVVLPNDRAPAVVLTLWYKAGSADETPGKSGVAHFLEHMMFRGTKNTKPGEFKKILGGLGGSVNAGTTFDYTFYVEIIAKEFLEKALSLEADRMEKMVINEGEFQTEREVVLQEYLTRIEAEPAGKFFQSVNAAYFAQHPYGRPVIGWKEELLNLTSKDLMDFYKKWYAPNNAILVVSGNVTEKEMRVLAKRYFGQIPKGNVPSRKRLKEPSNLVGHSKITHSHHKYGGVEFQNIYKVNQFEKTFKNYFIFKLIESILTPALQTVLVDDQEIAHIALSTYPSDHKDPYSFIIIAKPKSYKNMDKCQAIIEFLLKKIINHGIHEKIFKKAKEDLIFSLNASLSDLDDTALLFGTLMSIGYKFEDVKNWENILKGIELKEANDLLRSLFNTPPAITAIKSYGEN